MVFCSLGLKGSIKMELEPNDNNQTYIIPIVQEDKPIKVYFSGKEIPQINESVVFLFFTML